MLIDLHNLEVGIRILIPPFVVIGIMLDALFENLADLLKVAQIEVLVALLQPVAKL